MASQNHFQPQNFHLGKTLITGANGFLGSHLVDQFSKAGLSVTAAVHKLAQGYSRNLDVHFLELDVTNSEQLAEVISNLRPQSVIHCAAYGVSPDQNNFDLAFRTNVVGTLNLVRKAAELGAQRFIYIGSCSEYRAQELPIREDGSIETNSVYGSTKAAASQLLREFGRDAEIRTLVLRCFNMWGPGEAERRLVPYMIQCARTQSPCDLTNGDQIKDYSYVKDIANQIARLVCNPDAYRSDVINVGSGEGISVRQFASDVASILGISQLLRFGHRPSRKDEKFKLVADISLMKSLIGVYPRTSLEIGLKEMTDPKK